MVKPEADDVESAYGSEISEEKEHFSEEKEKEKPTENSVWYRWIKNRLNRITILEIIVIIILILLLFNSFRANSKDENMNSKIENIEKLIENFRINGKNDDFYGQMKQYMKKDESILNKNIEKSSKIKENPIESLKKARYEFNAASIEFLFGAYVDIKKSSSSNLNSYIWRDQSDLVLLDRPEPPADKVWCTYDKDPVITISLATFVKPTAISYQHFKWEGEVPKGAPKRYSVHACIDYYCETTEVIASNCRYQLTPDDQQEQFCQLLPNKNLTSISKVQFKFHQNHGNNEETCVSLIRFYGESEQIPKTRERQLEDSKWCSDLKYDYDHNPITYQLSTKDCKTLYSYGCCDICPECCRECLIVDFNWGSIVGWFFIIFFMFIASCCVIGLAVQCILQCLAACGCKCAKEAIEEMDRDKGQSC